MKEFRSKLNFQYIVGAADFAVKHVQGIDRRTMRWLVELVEVSGDGGWITEGELLEKMRLLRKYIPGSCQYSMLVLAELLELNLPQVASSLAAAEWPFKNIETGLLASPGVC
jgi:hypothetical protein